MRKSCVAGKLPKVIHSPTMRNLSVSFAMPKYEKLSFILEYTTNKTAYNPEKCVKKGCCKTFILQQPLFELKGK